MHVKSSKDSEHLKWVHDRIINVYKENENVDFLIRLREIIKTLDESERHFEDYLKFIEKRRNNT